MKNIKSRLLKLLRYFHYYFCLTQSYFFRSENSVRHINATLDVLPVKGPQGPPLPVKTDDLIQNQVDVQQTWTVKPEHLILTPPSISKYFLKLIKQHPSTKITVLLSMLVLVNMAWAIIVLHVMLHLNNNLGVNSCGYIVCISIILAT